MQQLMEYKKTEINTSDKIRIISLMYEGAINFIKIAKKKTLEQDIAGKGLYAGKATSIISELSSSLNMEAGGEIGINLRRLYDFVLEKLFSANLKNDIKAFDDAERVLEVLRNAWKEMEREFSKSASTIDNLERQLRV